MTQQVIFHDFSGLKNQNLNSMTSWFFSVLGTLANI